MRKKRLYQYPNWFVTFLEDEPILYFLQARKWEIGQMISEKAQHPYKVGDVLEAVAVFPCKRIAAKEACDAILKLKAQSVCVA